MPAVPVKLGKEAQVAASLGNSASLLIDKGQKSSVTTQIQVEESLTAPVAQGQKLGTLRVMSGEQVLSEVPLVAAQGVERLSYGDLFGKVLGKAAMAKEAT